MMLAHLLRLILWGVQAPGLPDRPPGGFRDELLGLAAAWGAQGRPLARNLGAQRRLSAGSAQTQRRLGVSALFPPAWPAQRSKLPLLSCKRPLYHDLDAQCRNQRTLTLSSQPGYLRGQVICSR